VQEWKMHQYNILIGCDQSYYDDWAVTLLKSIQRHNPHIVLHCHIVNPTKHNVLSSVSITTEDKTFSSVESKISYLQSVRFLAVANKFSKNENVITLDADSICTRAISKSELELLFKNQYVLKHHKDNRWLAGFIAFLDNGFRQEYAAELQSNSVDTWLWGRDQTVLNALAQNYDFCTLSKTWMSIGKIRQHSAFLTLKGEQKVSSRYLENYKKYLT